MTPTLTLFSAPKPFTNTHIRTIQRNAIQSWLALGPEVKVILIGAEAGLAETAAELGVQHLPDVRRNPSGTPLVSSIFEMALQASDSPLMAYINADILVQPNFLTGARQAAAQRSRFLLVGQRMDLDVRTPIDFGRGSHPVEGSASHPVEGGALPLRRTLGVSHPVEGSALPLRRTLGVSHPVEGSALPLRRTLGVSHPVEGSASHPVEGVECGWVERLQADLAARGRLHTRGGSDYFIYPRLCFTRVPDFAIGRAGWDNWMIYEARRQGWACVDATETIQIVHQDHDYSHLPQGQAHYRLPETFENVRLAGGKRTIFTLVDADYRLNNGVLLPAQISPEKFWRDVETFPLLRLRSYPLAQLTYALLNPKHAWFDLRNWLKMRSRDTLSRGGGGK